MLRPHPTAPLTDMTTPIRPLPRNTVLAVVGVSYRQDEVRTVKVDDDVILRHDTANPRDANAVTVETCDGRVLGFIGKDLAPRLSGVTPGGVWSAVVSEVLGQETVGLRVRIGQLIGRTDAAFGANLPGLRHRDDGFTDPAAGATIAPSPASADSNADKPDDTTPPVLVHSKNGRLLGVLREVDGNRVRVSRDGSVVSYPAAVVLVGDAVPA